MADLLTGRLTKWDDGRGFGFISPDAGGPDVFLHISGLASHGRPAVGDRVEYHFSTGDDGRPRAIDVRVTSWRRPRLTWGRVVSVGWLVAVAILAAVGFLSIWIPVLYFLVSLIALAVYAFDKRRARAGGRRVPEQTLQLLALAGGWPGALLAQQELRHKTQKKWFQFGFWLIVLVHIAVVTAWCAW